MTASNRIGIDLGGTKIEIIVLDPDGRERFRKRVPTPKGYHSTVQCIRDLVTEAERALRSSATVGVGIPGAEAPGTGRIKNANSTWLIGHPLASDLADALNRPVRLANDANCFALSEAVDGAGEGAEVVFGVILGTGVGGGIAVGGSVLAGHQSIAGEWGHTPLPWPTDDERPGHECYCGLRGCVETFLSGPGLARDHLEQSGRDWKPAEIVERAAAADVQAMAAMERYRDRLARSLAVVLNILDPDVVVLGGGMSRTPGLAQDVEGRLARWVFSDSVVTPIRVNRHGDSSGVRGAAWLWPV